MAELPRARPVGGRLEGACLGLAQWLALRRVFPRLPLRHWATATALGAALAWVIGMGAGSHAPSLPPPAPVLAAIVVAAGLVLGGLLGAAQALALRRHIAGVGRWILASANPGRTNALPVRLHRRRPDAGAGHQPLQHQRHGRLRRRDGHCPGDRLLWPRPGGARSQRRRDVSPPIRRSDRLTRPALKRRSGPRGRRISEINELGSAEHLTELHGDAHVALDLDLAHHLTRSSDRACAPSTCRSPRG